MDWSGMDCLWIIVMFLSAVWTLILTAPIHCRGSIGDAMLHFSKSDEETNSSRSWMAWGGAHFKQMFIFGWTTPLRKQVHNGEVCGSTLQSFNTMYCRDSTDSIFHSAVLEN